MDKTDQLFSSTDVSYMLWEQRERDRLLKGILFRILACGVIIGVCGILLIPAITGKDITIFAER